MTLSGIPYSNYSIYAYLVDSTPGYDEEVAIGGKTYYYSPTNAATYTQVTNTNSASYPAVNYVVASGLTGSSQTLSVQGIGEPYGSFAGFEIVNNTLNRGGILPAATPLSIAAGATLDLGGGSQQVSSLSDYAAGNGGNIINRGTAASALTLSPTGGSTTFSGMIQGGGTQGAISLVMNGSGTQVLAGSNTYTGPTTISQGKLAVDGWLTNSAVVVNGGTLGGTGYLSSGTVNAGGTLAPGDPLGVLNVSGNLVLAAGAAMDFDLDGVPTDDEISMSSGTLTFNGQQFSNFHFAWTDGFGPGKYTLINADLITGLASTSGSIDGYPATLAVQGSDLTLTVVPEPSTLRCWGPGRFCWDTHGGGGQERSRSAHYSSVCSVAAACCRRATSSSAITTATRLSNTRPPASISAYSPAPV